MARLAAADRLTRFVFLRRGGGCLAEPLVAERGFPARLTVARLRRAVLALLVVLPLLSGSVGPLPQAGAQTAVTVQFAKTTDTTIFGRPDPPIYYDYNVVEGGTLPLTLNFSAPTPRETTFTVNAGVVTGHAERGDDTATPDVDFIAGDHAITVPAGVRNHRVWIPIPWDAKIEGYETFTMTLATPPAGYAFGSVTSAWVQIVDAEVVPSNWGLRPDDTAVGDQFRLLFKTGNKRDATSPDLSIYDEFIRNRPPEHPWHADLVPFKDTFRLLGSARWGKYNWAAWRTATGVNLNDNRWPYTNGHTAFDTPVYWVGGILIKSGYDEFWSGGWNPANNLENQRHADGEAATDVGGATVGTLDVNGVGHISSFTGGTANLNGSIGGGGGATRVSRGSNTGGTFSTNSAINSGKRGFNDPGPFFGISAVFEVGDYVAGDPEAWVTANQASVTEGQNAVFTITLDKAAPRDLTINLMVAKREKARRYYIDLTKEGEQTVTIRRGQSSATFTVGTNDDKYDEPDGAAYVWLEPGSRYVMTRGAVATRQTVAKVTVADNDTQAAPQLVETDDTLEFGDYYEAFIKEGWRTQQAARLPLSASVNDFTLTYRIVPASEEGGSTATYGEDYRLRNITGHATSPDHTYDPATNRGVAEPQTGYSPWMWLPFEVIEDKRLEGDETIVIEMINTADDPVGGMTRYTITLRDDEPHSILKFDEREGVVYEGGQRDIYVHLEKGYRDVEHWALPRDATFWYCISGRSTARFNVDYQAILAGGGTMLTRGGCHTAVLPAGVTRMKLLTLNILDPDDKVEHDESIEIRLWPRGLSRSQNRLTYQFKAHDDPTAVIYGYQFPGDLFYVPDSSPGEIRPALERAINQPGAYLTNRAWTTIKDNDVPILEITGQDRPGKGGELITFTVRVTNGALLNPLSFDWTVEDTNGVIDDGMKQIDCERTFIVVAERDAMGNPIRWVTDPNDDSIDDTVMANALEFTNESCVGGKVSVTKHRGKSGYFYMDAGETERDITFLVRRNGANGYAQFIPEKKAEYTTPEGMETACVPINSGSCPAMQNGEGMGASEPTIVVPTTAVANMQVTAVDAVSVSVSWDAVPHATSYEVSWDGSGSQTTSIGILPSVMGTTATIQHNAQEAMTITVTVTPEYVDGNGQTQLASDLAGTATLDVGQGPDGTQDPDSQSADTQTAPQEQEDQDERQAPVATPAPHCVSDGLLDLVRDYYSANQNRAPNYGENWKRVLIAFGDVQDDQLTPYTASQARQSEQLWAGWKPVREALVCIEAANPPATPVISITAGSAVTEGTAATFTVTASPAPASDLDVAVTVSQSGDFAGTGSRTVTIPATGSATFPVATTDDSTDEPDGSVTATLSTGAGYTLSSNSSTATVAVSDNDDAPPPPPPPPPPSTNCVSDTMLDRVRHYYDINKDRAPGYGKNWKRVLIAFGDTTDTTLTAFTAAEATDRESNWSGWRPVRMTLECIEAS